MNTMKNNVQKGFTLIELMVVVAIIGILAAVALPAYSDYQASSKMTAALQEITGAKTEFEIKVNNGETITKVADLKSIKNATTKNCIITATGTTIQCKVQNAPSQIKDKLLIWTRSADGAWACTSDAGDDYRPKSCTAAP